MKDWNRLDRHVLSGESIDSFKRRLDQNMDRDHMWDGYILDYSKGGRQGAASCRSLTGLLQSPYFLCSYYTSNNSVFQVWEVHEEILFSPIGF